jgi:chlorite dismutase
MNDTTKPVPGGSRPRAAAAEDIEKIDILEHGRAADGTVLSSNTRLFMQLLAWGGCRETAPVIAALEGAGVRGVVYEDVNDPYGVALLTFHEDPSYFIDTVRGLLNAPPFTALVAKPALTMFGRTYALGYEPDLEDTLIRRPIARVLDPALRWAVWYPLRRAGSFEQLPPAEQRTILMEHGGIGHAFGRAGYAHDIRLACHGMDTHDNDFVVGLVGPDLHPLSAVVQRMRRTRQTSLHLERLGPFFVGRVAWQSRAGGA